MYHLCAQGPRTLESACICMPARHARNDYADRGKTARDACVRDLKDEHRADASQCRLEDDDGHAPEDACGRLLRVRERIETERLVEPHGRLLNGPPDSPVDLGHMICCAHSLVFLG